MAPAQLSGQRGRWVGIASLTAALEPRRARATIVPVADPEPTPELRALVGGRFAAVCGTCMRPSAPIAATSAAHAWADLKRLGWQAAFEKEEGRIVSTCPGCASKPAEDALKPAARGRRKR